MRWWVGTDVLLALEEGSAREIARKVARYTTMNLAVACHLVEELAEIGIVARIAPLVSSALASAMLPWTAEAARHVLAYVPARRHDFYGGGLLSRLCERRQDTTFHILADDGEHFAGQTNVVSLGWQDDMDAVYARCGVLLRMTHHDGLPRMVLEALARGRHVIYRWPAPACRQARTLEEVEAALDAIAVCGEPNRAGAAAVADHYGFSRTAALASETVRRAIDAWWKRAADAVAAWVPWWATLAARAGGAGQRQDLRYPSQQRGR